MTNTSIPNAHFYEMSTHWGRNKMPAIFQTLPNENIWIGDKPLSEPMMVRLPTHICVTRPQWVKYIDIPYIFHWTKQPLPISILLTLIDSQPVINRVWLIATQSAQHWYFMALFMIWFAPWIYHRDVIGASITGNSTCCSTNIVCTNNKEIIEYPHY